MNAVGISFAAGIPPGVVGWWCHRGTRLWRWVKGPHLDAAGIGSPSVPVTSPSGAVWSLLTGVAATAVAGASLLGRAWPVWLAPFLVAWAGALVLLALVDRETLVLPSKFIRSCAVVAACLLVAPVVVTKDWHYLESSALCAAVAAAGFGAWAFSRPKSLGLGDTRMACLVAMGAGTLSPGGCLVALACAPFVAGCVLARRRRLNSKHEATPIALGPFLALGGLMVVVISAV